MGVGQAGGEAGQIVDEQGTLTAVGPFVELLRPVFANRTLRGLRAKSSESEAVAAAESYFASLGPLLAAGAIMRCLALGVWGAHEENAACAVVARLLRRLDDSAAVPSWHEQLVNDACAYLARPFSDGERTLGLDAGVYCCHRRELYTLLVSLCAGGRFPALNGRVGVLLASQCDGADQTIRAYLLAEALRSGGQSNTVDASVWLERVGESLTDPDPDVVYAALVLATALLMPDLGSIDNTNSDSDDDDDDDNQMVRDVDGLLGVCFETPARLYRAGRVELARLALSLLSRMSGETFDFDELSPAFLHLVRFLGELQQRKDEETSKHLIGTLLNFIESQPRKLVAKYPQVVSSIALFCLSGFMNCTDWSLDDKQANKKQSLRDKLAANNNHDSDDEEDSNDDDDGKDNLMQPFTPASDYGELLSWLATVTNSVDLLNLVVKFDVRLSKSVDKPTHRAIAPYCLFLIAEGVAKPLLARLPELLPGLLARVDDADARVRYTMCFLLGGLSQDLGVVLIKRHAKQCLPGLLRLLGDSDAAVAALAANACFNWFSTAKSAAQLQPHLTALIDALLAALGGDDVDVDVRLASLLAVSALTDRVVVDDDLTALWPRLEAALRSAWAQLNGRLVGERLENLLDCVVSLAASVERTAALSLLTDVAAWLSARPTDADAVSPAALRAWVTVAAQLPNDARVRGALPSVVALHVDALSPERFLALDPDDEDEQSDATDFAVGASNVRVNYALVEQAGQLLSNLAVLVNHVDDAQLLFGAVAAKAEQMCRVAWAPTLVIRAIGLQLRLLKWLTKHADNPGAAVYAGYAKHIVPAAAAAVEELMNNWPLDQLEEPGALAVLLDRLAKHAGRGRSHAAMVSVHNCLVKVLTNFESHSDCHNDDDDEEEDDEDAVPPVLVEWCSQWSNKLFKYFGRDTYAPLFQRDVQDCAMRMAQSGERMAIEVGVCLLHDQIEFATDQAVVRQLLPTLASLAMHKNKNVRQAACSALGFSALNGGTAFAPFVAKTAALLNRVVSDKDARTKYTMATENAVAAFARLLLAWHATIPPPALKQYVLFFLRSLPVVADKIESPLTYENLMRLLDAIPDVFIGERRENVPGLLQVFAWLETCDPTLATQQTKDAAKQWHQKLSQQE